MTAIVKIDPKEYGLEEQKAKQVEAQFIPMLNKMTELEKKLNEVTAKPISPEVCKEAKSLRLEYVKVRTGTDAIHKELKSFYLNGGRFVDGWKNAQKFISEGIEKKLKDIEEHYDRIEEARIEKLRVERWGKLSAFTEVEPPALGSMMDEVFNNLLTGTEAAFNKKKADEAEAARILKESEEKKDEELKELREKNQVLTETLSGTPATPLGNPGVTSGTKRPDPVSDTVKVGVMIEIYKAIKLPEMSTAEGKRLAQDVKGLNDKVIAFIEKRKGGIK